MGFVVDDLALGQDFLRMLLFSRVIIIPPIIRTHVSFILASDSVIKLSLTLPLLVLPRHQTNFRDPRVVSIYLGQSFLAPFVRLPHRLINTPTTSSQLVIFLTSGWSPVLSTQCHCGTLRPHLVTQIWLSLDSTSKLAKADITQFLCNLNKLVIPCNLQFLDTVKITGFWKQGANENVWTTWG